MHSNVTHCGFTNLKFAEASGRRNEKEVLIAGSFPSRPNPLSLFASFPAPFRRLPGRLIKVKWLVFMEVIVPVWGERETHDWRVTGITKNERSADQYG